MADKLAAPQVLRNAATSVFAAVVGALALLLLYRYLVRALGIELFGVWSLIASATSVVHLGNPGLSASVVKHVASRLGRGERAEATAIVETALLTQAVVFAALLGVGYPVLCRLLLAVVPARFAVTALQVLPLTLVAFWLMMISEILLSALEGAQHVRLRSTIDVVSSLAGAAASFLGVYRFGFVGLGYAQVVQAILTVIVAWVAVRRRFDGASIVPRQWHLARATDLLRYGVSFQLASTAYALFDPTTKWLLGVFAGVAVTGYYEIASKIVGRLRVLLLSGVQVMVPVIAHVTETAPERARRAYVRALQLVIFMAIPIFAATAGVMPHLTVWIVGRYEPRLIAIGVFLAGVTLLGSLGMPAYFANLAQGRLRWNSTGGIAAPVVNACAGLLLGRLWGGAGVVLAYGIASVVSNGIIVWGYHHEERVRLVELHPARNARLLAAAVSASALSLAAYAAMRDMMPEVLLFAVAVALHLAIVVPSLLHHPTMRDVRLLLRPAARAIDDR